MAFNRMTSSANARFTIIIIIIIIIGRIFKSDFTATSRVFKYDLIELSSKFDYK